MTEPIEFVVVPGARLAVETHGDGPPIVLVHSAIVTRRSWDPVVPRLVAAGYRTVAYDLRGFGDSTAEPGEFFAHDDLLAVMDHAGIDRAPVVGNSMGTILALDAILAAPARFAAFVWVAGGIGGWDFDGWLKAEDALGEAEEAAEDAGDWDLAAELDTRLWVDGWRDGQNLPPARVDPSVRAAIKAMDRSVLERETGTRLRPEPGAVERLGELDLPTLVVIGELDTSGTRAAATKLAAEVPGARLVSLPDVAHIIGMEAPDRLAELIVEHLAPLPRWG